MLTLEKIGVLGKAAANGASMASPFWSSARLVLPGVINGFSSAMIEDVRSGRALVAMIMKS